jgi:hypothetical protein
MTVDIVDDISMNFGLIWADFEGLMHVFFFYGRFRSDQDFNFLAVFQHKTGMLRVLAHAR